MKPIRNILYKILVYFLIIICFIVIGIVCLMVGIIVYFFRFFGFLNDKIKILICKNFSHKWIVKYYENTENFHSTICKRCKEMILDEKEWIVVRRKEKINNLKYGK